MRESQEGLHDTDTVFLEPSWFVRAADGIRLRGSRCAGCGEVFFPKKVVCPVCFDGCLSDFSLSPRGTLHAFAQAAMGPPEMEKPYVMGFVDLPEKIKLYSLIVECEPWGRVLQVGMPMEMIVRPVKKDDQGRRVWSYVFRPVESGRTS